MKNSMIINTNCRWALLLLGVVLLAGCGKSPSEPGADPVVAPEPTPAVESPVVPVSAEPDPEVDSPLALPEGTPPLFQSWLMDAPSETFVDCGKIGARLEGGSYSLAAWIRLDQAGKIYSSLTKITGGLQTIVGNGARSNHGYYHDSLPGYWWAIHGDRLVHIMSDNESGSIAKGRSITQSAGAVPTNTWTHVAVVVDRSDHSVRLYLDGQPDPTIGNCAFIKTQTSNVPFTIGASDPTGKNAFQGQVARVQLYRGVLTAEAVAALHAQGAPGG